MVEFDYMGILHQIITTLTIAGFGGLFTYLWKMNSRMQKTEDRIAHLCDHMIKSEDDTDKLAEHDVEIKLLKVEITNIKLSVHDFRESMDKRFDELSHKLDRLTNTEYRDSRDNSAVTQNFRQRRK